MKKSPTLQVGAGGFPAQPSFSQSDPATDLVPVTPNDAADLALPAVALRCLPVSGAAGTVRVTTVDGNVRTTEIAVGELLPVQVVRVWSTGTSATGLEALV
jgi:hypothetical protein